MFGYTAAEAIGQSIRMIIPADRQGEEDMVLARIRAGEPIAHFETIRRRKDGTLIPISLTVSPIHDDDGAVIGASKIARDISDRVAGADWPRAGWPPSSSRPTTRSSPRISTASSRRGIAAAERMFGYTAAEAIGQSIRMLIPGGPADRRGRRARRRSAPARKSITTRPIRQRKDGTRALDFADRLAAPRRRRRRSSAPRRSPATSPSAPGC